MQRIVPGEDGFGVVLDGVFDLVGMGVGDGEDGLEVVEIGAAQNGFVADRLRGGRVVLGDAHGCDSCGVGDRRSGRTGRNGTRKRRADVSSPKSTTVGRCEEVRDDETGDDVDEGPRLGPRQEFVGERNEVGGGDTDDPRETLDGELTEHCARLGRQHERDVVVVAQLTGGGGDRAHEQILERCRRPRSGGAAS